MISKRASNSMLKEMVMNYREMLLQNPNAQAYLSPEQMVSDTKQLLGTNNRPYVLKDTVDGPDTRALFSHHFIEQFRSAQSTECMARMSKREKEVYYSYLTYSDIVFTIMMNNPNYTDDEIDAAANIEYLLNNTYGVPELVVRTLSNYESEEVYGESTNTQYTDTCYSYKHEW